MAFANWLLPQTHTHTRTHTYTHKHIMIWGVISHSYLWDFHNPWWSTVSTAPLLTFPLSTAATLQRSGEENERQWREVREKRGERRIRTGEKTDRRDEMRWWEMRWEGFLADEGDRVSESAWCSDDSITPAHSQLCQPTRTELTHALTLLWTKWDWWDMSYMSGQ